MLSTLFNLSISSTWKCFSWRISCLIGNVKRSSSSGSSRSLRKPAHLTTLLEASYPLLSTQCATNLTSQESTASVDSSLITYCPILTPLSRPFTTLQRSIQSPTISLNWSIIVTHYRACRNISLVNGPVPGPASRIRSGRFAFGIGATIALANAGELGRTIPIC